MIHIFLDSKGDVKSFGNKLIVKDLKICSLTHNTLLI